MINKEIAINILEDIEQSLQGDNWKDKSLKTINIYRKGLEVATSPKIKKLVTQQQEYIKKYGEDDKRILKLGKKIDEETQKIYNS